MLIRFWSFFLKTTRSLVGVMEAYLFYMQRAVVRFHYEVLRSIRSTVRMLACHAGDESSILS